MTKFLRRFGLLVPLAALSLAGGLNSFRRRGTVKRFANFADYPRRSDLIGNLARR